MVGIFHSDAVSILKSTQGRVVLQLEKGALQNMGITPEPSSVAVHPEEQGGTPAFTVDVQVRTVEYEVQLAHCVAYYIHGCTYVCTGGGVERVREGYTRT